MDTTRELVTWGYTQKCEKAIASLKKHGFLAKYCETIEEAKKHILNEAIEAANIGIGGSLSINDTDLADRLTQMGKRVMVVSAGMSFEEQLAIRRSHLTCDLFLTSTNALTLSGSLVNIDGVGNRVGAMVFGPPKVIVLAGRNKLVDGDIAAAIKRIKEFAAPANNKRLNFKTPCASTGLCCDCNSPERGCRIVSIIDRKPVFTEFMILIVNEDLGL